MKKLTQVHIAVVVDFEQKVEPGSFSDEMLEKEEGFEGQVVVRVLEWLLQNVSEVSALILYPEVYCWGSLANNKNHGTPD